MSKIKKFIGSVLMVMLLAMPTASAISLNQTVGQQTYTKLSGSSVVPINPAYESGSTSRPWAKGYFTDLDVAGVFTFGGTMSGSLDLNGNPLIVDVDGDTSITADIDDQIDFQIAGVDMFTLGTGGLTVFDSTGGDAVSLAHNATDSILTTSAGDLRIVLENNKNLSITDLATNATQKDSIITGQHFTNAEEDAVLIFGQQQVSTNTVNFGGGSSVNNSATDVKFYTAATNTTVTGTERMSIDNAGTVSMENQVHMVGPTGTTVNSLIMEDSETGNDVLSFQAWSTLGQSFSFYNLNRQFNGTAWQLMDDTTEGLSMQLRGAGSHNGLALYSFASGSTAQALRFNVGLDGVTDFLPKSIANGEAADGDGAVFIEQILNDTTTGAGTAGTYSGHRVAITETDSGAYAEVLAYAVGQEGQEPWSIGTDGSMNFADATTSATFAMDNSGNLDIDFASGDRQVTFGEVEGIIASVATTDATNKGGRFGTGHYLNAEEPFYFFSSSTTASANVANWGGGTVSGNAATSLRLILAANNTTTTGSKLLEFAAALPAATGAGTDADALDLFIRGLDGGIDDAGTGGNAAGDIKWIAGEGSDAKAASGSNGGAGGNYTFQLSAGGAADGAGQPGNNGGFQIFGSGGGELFDVNDGGSYSIISQSGEGKRSVGSGETIGAAAATIFSMMTDNDSAVYISGHVSGMKSDGSEVGFYTIEAGYQNDGGTLSEQFDTTGPDSEDDANWDCTIAPNSTDIEVTCGTAAAGDDITWTAFVDITVTEVTP
jgi:hypothetical protein